MAGLAPRSGQVKNASGRGETMKLFMFYVGGDCGNSNIELHDVRFSAGETPEACHEDLRRQWWGTPKSLHLDCWGAVEQVDGYDIALGPARSEQSEMKLFFLNLGGYEPDNFEELHRNVLIVATDVKAAIVRSLGQVRPWLTPHRDKAFEVEKSLNLSETLFDRGIALILTPAVTIRPFRFTSRYLRLS
jgi:hypothetical protein